MVEAKFTPLEVLAVRGDVDTRRFYSKIPNIDENQIKRGRELGRFLEDKTGGSIGKGIFQEALRYGQDASYNRSDIDEMLSKFGAGEVKEDKTGIFIRKEDAVEIAL